MTIAQRTLRTGTGFWRIIKSFLRFGIVSIVFLFILINASFLSYKAGSIEPFINEVGGSAIIVTQGLNEVSIEAINSSDDLSLWGRILIIARLVGSFAILYAWIRVWVWIVSHSPLGGDTAKRFNNLFIAVLFFFISQYGFILFILATGIGSEIIDVSIGLSNLKIPHQAFLNFGLAVGVIAGWISNLWGNVN